MNDFERGFIDKTAALNLKSIAKGVGKAAFGIGEAASGVKKAVKPVLNKMKSYGGMAYNTAKDVAKSGVVQDRAMSLYKSVKRQF